MKNEGQEDKTGLVSHGYPWGGEDTKGVGEG
jgi:hypothetical protein